MVTRCARNTLQHGHFAQHAHEPLFVLAARHLLHRVVTEIYAAYLMAHQVHCAVAARSESFFFLEKSAVVATVHEVRQSGGLFDGTFYIW